METTAVISTRPPLLALTGLRFFAALVVVGAHWNGQRGPELFRAYLSNGSNGVTLFFILSGFVLAYNYSGRLDPTLKSVQRFYHSRFARIYPLYILTLIFGTIVILLTKAHRDESTESLITSWLANVFSVQIWDADFFLWNAPNWSIPTEIAFYLVFPLLLFWLVPEHRSLKGLISTGLLIWLAQIVVFVTGYQALYGSKSGEFFLYRSPIFRVWEFALGVVLGAFVVRHLFGGEKSRAGAMLTLSRTSRNKIAVFAIGIIALVPFAAYQLSFGSGSAPNGVDTLIAGQFLFPIYTPVFVALLATIGFGATFLHRVLASPKIVVLGESSYALYLIHYPILLLVQHYTPSGSASRLVFLALSLPAMIIASVLIYRLIEVPSRAFLRPKPARLESMATSIPVTSKETSESGQFVAN
jgi:peptidoglycan/LPS O-acetylase OafA/YrhL